MHKNNTSISAQAQQQDAVDPVCGTTVDPRDAAGTDVNEGRTYYFCSNACMEKFTAEPEKYTDTRPTNAAYNGTRAPSKSEAVAYTCR